MPKHRRTRRDQVGNPAVNFEPATDDPMAYGALSLHELFERQARQLLDRTDLGEEQKQCLLAAMSCPCCGGGGGMFYTVKLKR